MEDTYVKLRRKFWNSRIVRALTPTKKLVYLHTLTASMGNHTGCYKAHPVAMSEEAGFPLNTYMKAIKELESAGVVFYDADYQIWYVVNALDKNPPDNHNAMTKLIKYLMPLPESPLVVRCATWLCEYAEQKGWAKDYPEWSDKWLTVARQIEAQEPYSIPSKTPHDNDNGIDYEKSFDVFWELWPKKKAKSDALKAWTALKPETKDGWLAFEILANVQVRAIADKDWLKDNGKYIPYPATYIRQGRWTDEWERDAKSQKRKLT